VDKKGLEDLEKLLSSLRDPQEGCPWDLKQDWKSLTKHTIEEVYECVDAIEHNDNAHVKEELGDLLFQVFFYAQIANEKELFDIHDIATAVVKKMIERHPHVFSDEKYESEDQHLKKWEDKKKTEKTRNHIFDDIPSQLPALMFAQKVQKRASGTGVDWKNVEMPLQKCQEEMLELNEAVNRGDSFAIEEELGDLLFSVVSVARHTKIDAESALRRSITKFQKRVRYCENQAKHQGADLSDLETEALLKLWNNAKKEEYP
jgi:ATP diphosphatase